MAKCCRRQARINQFADSIWKLFFTLLLSSRNRPFCALLPVCQNMEHANMEHGTCTELSVRSLHNKFIDARPGLYAGHVRFAGNFQT